MSRRRARPRLGGRSWTIRDGSGFRSISLRLAAWLTAIPGGSPRLGLRRQDAAALAAAASDRLIEEQRDFLQAPRILQRLGSLADGAPDSPAAAFLEPSGRWNNLINAICTYVNGAELDRVSARDFGRYDDTGVNYRVVGGYGAVIARHGASLPVVLGCPVQRIDHGGRRLRVKRQTARSGGCGHRHAKGLLAADSLHPCPTKMEAAAALPGALRQAVPVACRRRRIRQGHARGRADRTETATITCAVRLAADRAYFGGRWRRGSRPMRAHPRLRRRRAGRPARQRFARRVKLLHLHRWGVDPFSRGSYSYALPGKADCRAALATPVDDRLFFAGEACSEGDYSTAHGAYLTGIAAVEQAIVARRP
jgi:monoamine oxidase